MIEELKRLIVISYHGDTIRAAVKLGGVEYAVESPTVCTTERMAMRDLLRCLARVQDEEE